MSETHSVKDTKVMSSFLFLETERRPWKSYTRVSLGLHTQVTSTKLPDYVIYLQIWLCTFKSIRLRKSIVSEELLKHQQGCTKLGSGTIGGTWEVECMYFHSTCSLFNHIIPTSSGSAAKCQPSFQDSAGNCRTKYSVQQNSCCSSQTYVQNCQSQLLVGCCRTS